MRKGIAMRTLDVPFPSIAVPDDSDGPPAPQFAGRGARAVSPIDSGDGSRPTLTIRQRDVLDLVAKGLSYREISGVLSLSYHTVAWYLKEIYRKLAVRSRGEAVFEARQMGVLE